MYFIIAAIAFVLIVSITPKEKYIGAIPLALVWPVLIPACVYFTIKKYVFKRHGPSPNPIYWELEALAIFATTAFILIAWKFPQLFN